MDQDVSKVFILPYHMKNLMLRENNKSMFEDPEIKFLKSLDDEMKKTLYETGLTPEIKYKKYVEVLNKYGTVMKNVTKPFEIEIKEKQPPPKVEENDERIQEQQQPEDMANQQEQQIQQQQPSTSTSRPQIQSIAAPQQQMKYSDKIDENISKMKTADRIKAREIIENLRNDSKVKWGDDGQMYYNKKPIRGSNIVETLNDFIRQRKNTHPGFVETAVTLHNKNFNSRNINNADAYNSVTRRIKNKYVTDIMDQYKNRQNGLEDSDDQDDDEYLSSKEDLDDEENDSNTTIQLGNGKRFNYRQECYKDKLYKRLRL